jgi:hypothetical protein
MKTTATIILATLFAFAARAQEATNADLRQHQSEATPAESHAIPNADVPERSEIDQAFKQTSLGKEADVSRLHLEWRQLANRMVNDPEIVAAKKSAAAARTDLEKRERLRTYYNLYYGKMRALASSSEMKNALDALKTEHLSHINQPRVRHETDEALPTPTPAHRKQHKS